jgi:hypothetical protein
MSKKKKKKSNEVNVTIRLEAGKLPIFKMGGDNYEEVNEDEGDCEALCPVFNKVEKLEKENAELKEKISQLENPQ